MDDLDVSKIKTKEDEREALKSLNQKLLNYTQTVKEDAKLNNKKLQSRIAEMEIQINNLKANEDALNEQIKILEEETESLKHTRSSLETDLASSNVKHDHVTKERDQLQTKLRSLAEKLASLTREKDEEILRYQNEIRVIREGSHGSNNVNLHESLIQKIQRHFEMSYKAKETQLETRLQHQKDKHKTKKLSLKTQIAELQRQMNESKGEENQNSDLSHLEEIVQYHELLKRIKESDETSADDVTNHEESYKSEGENVKKIKDGPNSEAGHESDHERLNEPIEEGNLEAAPLPGDVEELKEQVVEEAARAEDNDEEEKEKKSESEKQAIAE